MRIARRGQMDVVAVQETVGHTYSLDASTARGVEMLLPVHLRLMGALGTAALDFGSVC